MAPTSAMDIVFVLLKKFQVAKVEIYVMYHFDSKNL